MLAQAVLAYLMELLAIHNTMQVVVVAVGIIPLIPLVA
jgi:hypothetical protein